MRILIFATALAAGSVMAEEFIGSDACAACHQEQFQDWQGSHHQLAMAEATDETVLGDFDQSRFEYFSVASTFFREDGEFIVRTDNSEGELQDFTIAYTFGWYPLQQYLVEFDDGRLQTLSIAWDARPADEGGQRWFHLQPDEFVHADDVLHWTGFGMNWNTNCAECHSTNLQKNYDVSTNSFSTTWSEISVGCEACHGPGSEHLAWFADQTDDPLKGFTYSLADTNHWTRALDQDTATRASPDGADLPLQQQVCASCHSRRFKLGNDTDADFYNNHLLQPIEPGLYHQDGQILDEVYVYGSYLQSKMHMAGVTCSNCHNPHNAELIAPGDAVCMQCHNPEKFGSTDHHLHTVESAGARCVNCHMPETTYMLVDPRRDHSIRIPRPDLGEPNACTQCHSDQTSEWATSLLEQQFGTPARNTAESLSAIWESDSNALNRLLRLIGDGQTPDFVVASVLPELARHQDQRAVTTAIQHLNDPYAPTRAAAVDVLRSLPLQDRYQLLNGLIRDNNPIVRQAATAALAEIPLDRLPENLRANLSDAFDAYESDMQASLDNPAIATQLGDFYARRGQNNLAINAYLQAQVIEPQFLPALLNLADLYRASGDEENALETLLGAESAAEDQPDIQYALGLAYVRKQERERATAYFRAASELAPERANYRYAWALSLFETGSQEEALVVVEQGLELMPENQQLLYTLGYFYEETGQREQAINTYRSVLELNPSHQGALQQLRRLGAR